MAKLQIKDGELNKGLEFWHTVSTPRDQMFQQTLLIFFTVAAINQFQLCEIHDSLFHPGLNPVTHSLKTKNIAVSVDEVHKMIWSNKTCANWKPCFPKTKNHNLVKATQPFERISIDFKGLLVSVTKNKYILAINDEYSKYPIAITYSKISTDTFIKNLSSIF